MNVQFNLSALTPDEWSQLTNINHALDFLATRVDLLDSYLIHTQTTPWEVLISAVKFDNQLLFETVYNTYCKAINSQELRNLRAIVIEHGRLNMLQYLLNHDLSQSGCLTISARLGQLNLVKYLLSQGSYINENDGAPLIDSIEFGQNSVAHYLITMNADLTIDQTQPLRSALEKGNTLLVQLILEKGRDRGIKINIIDPSKREKYIMRARLDDDQTLINILTG